MKKKTERNGEGETKKNMINPPETKKLFE